MTRPNMTRSSMTQSRTIAFRCDASATIGTGHLMRCLTLADELKQRGAGCVFAIGTDDPLAIENIRSRGHHAHRLPAPLAEPDARVTAADSAMSKDAFRAGIDWLVVDHYRLGAAWERMLRPLARKILVLDDLADRQHDADIVVDPTLGRKAGDYRDLTPERCDILTGGAYALLRPEFAHLRNSLRRAADSPLHLHMGFGGGVWSADAWSLLEKLVVRAPTLRITANAASEEGMPETIRALAPRVSVKIASKTVSADMAACTVALGAPGSMTWERFCLGLPFGCLTTHVTQEEPVALLARNEYLAALGRLRTPDDALMQDILSFLDDRAHQAKLARKAAGAVDGEGCRRVADAMLGAGH